MKTEHHQKDVRTNSKGAIYDIDEELSGAENKGNYFDSENGRISSSRGNKGAWEKIRGEEVEHSNIYPGDWFNMCSITVNDDIFELWVEKNDADSPYIVINGNVMGKSENMPWLYEFRIQDSKNENCIGGEVFLTDFNVPPMIFNIKAIKDAFANGELTYFDDFNPELYYINLTSPLDIPIFKGLVNLGGGGGLPVGSYQYSLRYVTEEGDATNWGPLTPAIPVTQSLSTASSQFPSIKTYGSNSNIANPTSYGVELKFRVTNINNYDYIEIRRISYNSEAGVSVVQNGVIVAKIPIEPGQISIEEFIDPKDSNIDEETLADNEELTQLGAIAKAKTIRYYDKKVVLMNFETPSKVAEIDFLEYNGNKILPVVDSLGKIGFNSPVNHAYKKNYASNEKYSFAVNLFDGYGGSGFVVEDDDLKNIEAPSRRAPLSSDSIDLSTGSVVAASVDSNADNTFEVFDHEDAVEKTDLASFKNIMKKGSKGSGNVNEFSPDAGFGGTVKSEEIGYKPYTPTEDNDSNTQGHNYVVNPRVSDSNFDYAYAPKGFGCNYYSRGFAIGGVDNLPFWAKSFSVVRSERAGRVVCQGIGMYSLTKGDFGTFQNNAAATKSQKKFWFHSPDIESGIVSQDLLDDIQSNPQNYSVKFSSPLGFFSEVYGFEKNLETTNRDRLIDMVTYARVIRDNGQINPNESGSMGVGGLVAYNRYRNNNNAGQGAFNTPEGGEKIFDVAGFNSVSDGRSSFHEIETVESIYNVSSTGGSGDNDFDDQGMKDFTEPFYIINIIRTGAEVQDLNINNYYSTGHYQKIESIIGIGDSTAGQSFELVDERWEDCIPSLTASGFNSGGESFVYLVDDQQNERKFFNVTYKTPAEVNVIINDISLNGFYTTLGGATVVGIYTHSQDAQGNIFLNFDDSISYPQEDERVVVKYDKTRPVKFFGGDTVVGENTFCPIDKEADASESETEEQFDFNIGFPYRKFTMNPRHYVVRNTNGANKIQNDNTLSLGYLRQMIVMYAAESITSSSFSFNGEFPLEFYPLTNYVMRPNRFNDSSFEDAVTDDIADDNNMFLDYFDDYPEEYTIWKYGGFRFSQQFNLDYSVIGPSIFFSKPKVGFKEENMFCTGVAWSLSRAINQQDSPGLKTFPATNRFFISDDNGAIKKAYSATTGGKGDNLYALTNSGICLLLTKKSILSNLDANDLTTTSIDTFIGGEYWISKEIGCYGEMWRGAAEGSVEFNSESGKIELESLFFPNRNSIFRLTENRIENILKGKYRARTISSLENIGEGYLKHMEGFYNKNNNEYWLQIPDFFGAVLKGTQRCFVYDQNESNWVGRFHYNFDSYTSLDNKNYGFRDGEMFLLDSGFEINGAPIEAYLIQSTSIIEPAEKEFISIEINSGPRGKMKPTEISFIDEEMTTLCRLNESLFGPSYLRQYDGWFGQIPRKEASVSPTRDRVQYRLIFFKIFHNFEEDFKVVSSVIQFKQMK